MPEDKRWTYGDDGHLLEALERFSGKSRETIKKNARVLADILNIELPKTEGKKMARKGYKSITIKEKSFRLLEKIQSLEKQPSIPETVNQLAEFYLESKRL